MIIDFDICKPEKTIDEQLLRIDEELMEVRGALAVYQVSQSQKDRAEVLFELLDTMNAALTAICIMFDSDEIAAGVQYVNAKNFVRHYLEDSDE